MTDILLRLSCSSAIVGVLSRAYPQMAPEFMAYQATIIKCCRDFDGIAWAQYDRIYRHQVAQIKDLCWSKLNPTLTLYSLCFAGKAKRHVACTFCLSDIHSSDQCPDNPAKFFLLWQQPMPALAAPVLPAPKPCICHFLMQGMGHAAHIGNANLPTSAHYAEGLTPAVGRRGNI